MGAGGEGDEGAEWGGGHRAVLDCPGGGAQAVWLWQDPFEKTEQELQEPLGPRVPALDKPMSIESVMPSNHLILCHSHFLLPPIPQSTSPPTGVGDQELGHCPQGHSDYTHHLPRGLSQPGPRLLQLAQALTTSWARLSPACSGSIKGQPRQRQDCPLGTGGPTHPWDLTTLALFHSSLRPALLTSGTHISFFVVQSLSCVRQIGRAHV